MSTQKTPLEIIAGAAKTPEYAPPAIKALMKRLDVNEKAFALLLNVTPMTIRLWTSGAVKPCGTSKRLMQIYEICPEAVNCITGAAMKDSKEVK
jgi:putative transcriptional regulator